MALKRTYLLPNTVTAFGLACSLFVIFKVNMIEPGTSSYQMVLTSVLLLLVAAVADFVDGALARALRAESEFGFVFDTLADAVSFGVAPAVLMLKTLSLEQGTFDSVLAVTGSMVYSICGVLRLVRFNVKASEARGNEELMAAQKKHFTGLPIPGAAAAAVAANLLFLYPIAETWLAPLEPYRPIILTSVMLILGYLMVSPLKFPSLKVLHFRIPSFQLAFVTVVVAILFLYGILYFFPIVLAALAWAYIVVALILSSIRMIAGKKSKTLEEFEPDDDDFEG